MNEIISMFSFEDTSPFRTGSRKSIFQRELIQISPCASHTRDPFFKLNVILSFENVIYRVGVLNSPRTIGTLSLFVLGFL